MLALTLCQKKDDTSLKWQWRKGRAQSQKVTDKSIEEDAKERKEKKDHAKDSRTNGSRRNGRRKEDATKESKGKDSLLRHNAKTKKEALKYQRRNRGTQYQRFVHFIHSFIHVQ